MSERSSSLCGVDGYDDTFGDDPELGEGLIEQDGPGLFDAPDPEPPAADPVQQPTAVPVQAPLAAAAPVVAPAPRMEEPPPPPLALYRRYRPDGSLREDIVGLVDEPIDGEPLLRPAVRAGRRVGSLPDLAWSRVRAAVELGRLPQPLRELVPMKYPVRMSAGVRDLARSMTRSGRGS